jgi:hypothetical protein
MIGKTAYKVEADPMETRLFFTHLLSNLAKESSFHQPIVYP